MNRISVNCRELSVNLSKVVFEAEIEEIIDFGSVVAVLIVPKKAFAFSNNLYGVIDGSIAWRVQDVREYNPIFDSYPYTGIEAYEKDASLILATDFDGGRFLINPHNGKIIGTESWVK